MANERKLNILFVCTANVCRSPLAEGFMREHATRQGAPIHAMSASVHSTQRIMDPMVTKIFKDHGVVVPPKYSIPLSTELVDDADLILTMTGQHAIDVASRFRQAMTKIFTLDHFAQIAHQRRPEESLDEWLTVVRSCARHYPAHPGTEDIADPAGKDDALFRSVGAQIDALTDRIAIAIGSA